MSEYDIIQRTKNIPLTVDSLRTNLAALGITSGMTLLVHSSLSALGWVCGGPVAVILALEEIIGPTGTLVMPTHSNDFEPSLWQNPPVPSAWWKIIQQETPVYSPDITPTRGMGVIPECFRKQTGVLRSSHSQYSFAAWGAQASTIIERHALGFGLGENSPLARLYDLDGSILLLGVGHSNNTSLHLAEYRVEYGGKQFITVGVPLMVDGHRQWVKFQDIKLNDTDFETIGEAFTQETEWVHQGQIGNGTALLMRQRTLVDFAVQWMEKNRRGG